MEAIEHHLTPQMAGAKIQGKTQENASN